VQLQHTATLSIIHNDYDAHGIPGAAFVTHSFVKQHQKIAYQHRKTEQHNTPFPQNLQRLCRLGLQQRGELGYGRMQRSVARLFFVDGFVSNPSVLHTPQPMVLSSTTQVSTRTNSKGSLLNLHQTTTSYVSSIFCFCFLCPSFLVRKEGSICSAKTICVSSSHMCVICV
jgi:hypothetical protein